MRPRLRTFAGVVLFFALIVGLALLFGRFAPWIGASRSIADGRTDHADRFDHVGD